MAKNYTTNHINVVNAENPMRMGFYVPGHGIVTQIRKDETPKPGDLFKMAVEMNRKKAQNKK